MIQKKAFSLLENLIPEVRNFRILAKLSVDGEVFLGLPRRKTHPLQARFNRHEEAIYLHAEIDAIRQALSHYHAKQTLAKAKLEIIRIRRTTNLSTSDYEVCLARPCSGCWKAIDFYGISCVQWTTNEANVIGEYKKHDNRQL